MKKNLFRTNHAYWFCKRLGIYNIVSGPGEGFEIDYRNFSRVAEWIKNRSKDFPWIYNRREIDFAGNYNHFYPTLMRSDKIIGYIKVAVGRAYVEDYEGDIALRDDEAFIYDTFILPEFRGKHFGRILLKNTLGILRENNFSFVFCHIPGWNTASLKLYEWARFQRIGDIRYFRLINFRYFSYDPALMKSRGRELYIV